MKNICSKVNAWKISTVTYSKARKCNNHRFYKLKINVFKCNIPKQAKQLKSVITLH